MKVTFRYANLYFNAEVDYLPPNEDNPDSTCIIFDLQTVKGDDANFMLESDDFFDGLQEACRQQCEIILEGE